ncbi:MAG: TetR/AcrR family transcriptional regulator [Roseibium sp.]|uniref:TetR/AcrR family transcriptional regulator n=1 Tax=Roseibium sp. TaxID=1936156 RepID=UPI001B294AC8|nr:TetR/AcrR family transcriptional regulator [Roseibium sp.]MBO6893898.1 TetR/AcrR family transcriptional regulator [Roseibium sp.]MBO6931397.1 TetR/AcrR family transcriptional regulator [Roseibium sp.]
MPRASKAEKAKNHQRIIEEAARQIRAGGIEGLGIADLMKSVGMTHGGFYRHFKDKEDLSVAAINHAFETFSERLERDLDELGAEAALKAFVQRYLSTEHVKNPSIGCPASALSGQAVRCTDAERAAISRGVSRIEALLEKALCDLPTRIPLSAASFFSLLVGGVVLARSATAEKDAEHVLAKSRLLLEDIGLLQPQ